MGFAAAGTCYIDYPTALVGWCQSVVPGSTATSCQSCDATTGLCTLQSMSPTGTAQTSQIPVYAPACDVPVMDYSVLAQMWAFGISIVVAIFVLGRGTGMILKLFKH